MLTPAIDGVLKVKLGNATAMDIMKAGSFVLGITTTYDQGYQSLKKGKKDKRIQDLESFQVLIPYLNTFLQKNEGSVVNYQRDEKHCLERCFVCPGIMNSKLQYVRPMISLDAAHLKSYWKGTLYIATVQSAMNEIFPIAIGISYDNEGSEGWKYFLRLLKESCPILSATHPLLRCNSFCYFTFISDRDKGLVDAVSEIFPSNHHVNCTVHICRNVLAKFGTISAKCATNICSTFSVRN